MTVLQTEQRGRVSILTFNDPDRRNVVSDELNAALLRAFDDMEANKDVGAVVLTGAGRAFCAGAVLDNLLAAGEGDSYLPDIYSGFLRVAHSTLPTVAAVNGAAVGAGMNMVLACDLVVAGQSALFDTRFLSIGLHPGGGHTWRLRNITDLQTAKAMVLFKQVLDGGEAASRGLAWECVDDADLVDVAVGYAELAAAHPKELVARSKETLHSTAGVTASEESVKLEIGPQVWSMHQPAFMEMVKGLKSRISNKS
ncbi:MAG: enoyl-CoA hydratase-related protein [Acidimicrobiales bacterium]|jgi:enoyl-CoA hydratase|nr:enoyl-CoA hydratase [Acidimicrobiaceae bacterium]MDP6076821.1 enoyl-CoA hydratase-related protein [Acidimicrobiales bacterium]MDP7258823.1 enoyl-CoA hydratase-related protein [Acidimicrobiales bacterium]HJO79029.1 enoyl-CoA hydratase-related protein [Acidimicrobiales bacterium]|tara:strand:- start:10081 stop:10842 length:762 start_codon:yes stop_codon:yes gene_type:complete